MDSLRRLRLLLIFLLLFSVATLMNFLIATKPGFSFWRFFSFFTNQSNLVLALFFLWEAMRRWQKKPLSRPTYDHIRGALILYMTMTSGIYWTLIHRLIHIDSTPAYVANVFLHSGGLAFLLVDWWKDRPETRMNRRSLGLWLIYPVLYVAVIMLVGMIQDWYPYTFLNISKLGVGPWLLWTSGMMVGIGLAAYAIIRVNNRLIRIH